MNLFSTAYHYLRVGRAILGLTRNPERTDLVFVIADSLHKLRKYQAMKQILQANPAAMKIIAERKLLEGFSLQALAKLPAGTLGRVYADHMLGLKLDPDFYPRPTEITDETFVFLRMRQTHDIWHVVTGFDTSVCGELGLQSFALAQMALPLPLVIIGGSLIKCVFNDQELLVAKMEAIVKGWKMGRSANPFFPYDWELAWNKNLSSVRNELGISVL